MIETNNFITDTVKYVRDTLASGLTDPISSLRSGRDKFVMTSYPERPVKYPIITVIENGTADDRPAGMQSIINLVSIPVEIRVWAKDMKTKDRLATQTYNLLRSIQFSGASLASTEAGLYDFKLNSMVNVDESGKAGIKSKVMEVEYLYITT